MNLMNTNNVQIVWGLWYTRGYKQNKCDNISEYGNDVLPLGDTQIRQALVVIFYSTTECLVYRKIDDERLLMTTVPSKVKGIIIHRRMLIKNNLIEHMVVTNIC